MRRGLIVLLLVNLVLTLVALGWLTWISTEPRDWFPGAYAAKGPPGDKGPRGEVGPPGPAGPVGPDAQVAIDDLGIRLDELETRVEEVEALAEEAGNAAEIAQAAADDVIATVDNICTEFSFYSGAFRPGGAWAAGEERARGILRENLGGATFQVGTSRRVSNRS